MERNERWALNGRSQTREVGPISVHVEDGGGGIWRTHVRGERGGVRVWEGSETGAKEAAATVEKLLLDAIRWGASEGAAHVEEWATGRDRELAG